MANFSSAMLSVCAALVLTLANCKYASVLTEGKERMAHSTGWSSEPKQKWDYVNVRPAAYMFWWLYYADDYQDKPLIIWLQGGPGASSTGYGNIGEIGPLDLNLNPRNTTWLSEASLLFIDQPVGSGYSYVTREDAYTTNIREISDDLLTMLKNFLKKIPEFQRRPLFIFSESYGGKMTAAFSQVLYKAIQTGDIQCNFKGFAMGDSWISPLDYVLTWGPYLYSTSLVDDASLATINESAMACKAAYDSEDFVKATHLWSQTETLIDGLTGGVNFYNILQWKSPFNRKPDSSIVSPLQKLFWRHVGCLNTPDLATLMNGPIREKLGIIPKNVTWGGQESMVFQKQNADFMKPVIDIVDNLLENTKLKIVIYNGQLDLICDTMGTEMWLQKSKWSGLPKYYNASRKPFYTGSGENGPAGYLKSYKNFNFFWILDAGHMIPYDQGEAARWMVKRVISDT